MNENTKESVTVDLTHRLGLGAELDSAYALGEAIAAITERSSSVLHMLATQFADKENPSRLSDETIFGVIDSVICDLSDITAAVGHYNKNVQP